jgi:hypothetical protein
MADPRNAISIATLRANRFASVVAFGIIDLQDVRREDFSQGFWEGFREQNERLYGPKPFND